MAVLQRTLLAPHLPECLNCTSKMFLIFFVFVVGREDVGVVVVEVEFTVNLIESSQCLARMAPTATVRGPAGRLRCITGGTTLVRSGFPRCRQYARGIAQVLYDDP